MKRIFQDYSTLSNNLISLFEDPDGNDSNFKIKTPDRTFFCHRNILKYRSSYFEGLFRSNYQETQQGEITFNDISTQVMEKVLIFLYSGRVEMDRENAVDILLVANKLLIENLKQFSEQFVSENLTDENIWDVCNIATHFQCEYLQKKCVDFIGLKADFFLHQKGFLEIAESLFEMILKSTYLVVNKELNLVYSLIKWGQKQTEQIVQNVVKGIQLEEVAEKISNLIRFIRFVSISRDEYLKIKEMKVIPKDLDEDLSDFYSSTSSQRNKIINESLTNEKKIYFNPRCSRYFLSSDILRGTREYQENLEKWVNDKDFLENMELRFFANQGETNTKNFYTDCGGAGKTLIIIQSQEGFVFGGYTSIGWPTSVSYNEINDNQAFLFTLKNPLGFSPDKLPIIQGNEYMALYSEDGYGPIFGSGYDLAIQSDLINGQSDIGYTYQAPAGIMSGSNLSQTFFSGSNSFHIQRMEVFCERKI
ncbi:pep-cterm sorting domain-containing protein [Anaeramoeba ignava]|uniref:Pep-cterm sorting domain-containing protein n=1 Tax=Anaeramoeba ignava TaxID=1746090 RepID=A0A9Q0R9T6_ANAIG|nr:pep-cterm sorting domain-containing protein [Anaeramoeba ignava]